MLYNEGDASKMLNQDFRIHTTGIGSLPFDQISEALRFAFSHTIPYLPQLPKHSPKELMIHQTLMGFPGFKLTPEGESIIHTPQWRNRRDQFIQSIHHALKGNPKQSFEKSWLSKSFKCWDHFLRGVKTHSFHRVKAQIAGPITCIQYLRNEKKEPIEHSQDLCTDLFDFISVKALAMGYEIQLTGATPLLFIDEPALFMSSTREEIKLTHWHGLHALIQALKTHQIEVGLHCCGKILWPDLLRLTPDWVSLDMDLSWQPFLTEMSLPQNKEALGVWIEAQGKLAVGLSQSSLLRFSLKDLESQLLMHFAQHPAWVEYTMKNLILTPSCGLAYHSIRETYQTLLCMQQISESYKS